jgi:hypothetical protein
MNNLRTILAIGFIGIYIFACDSSLKRASEEPAVARVGDSYLYESEISQAVPKGINAKDSIALARNYINTWVKGELILQKAKINLRPEQLDFEEQLNDYKSSLIRYTYETELIRQNLDTNVSDYEIKEYYNQNQNNFQLKHNIIRVNFVGISQDSLHHERMFKDLLYTEDSTSNNELEQFCKEYAEDYFLEDSWVAFNDLLSHIPIKTYNKEEYLRNNKRITYSDSLTKYLIYFKEFKIKDDISPLSFEQGNIRNILINKRKLELIKDMEEDVFNQAMQKNEFEIYY